MANFRHLVFFVGVGKDGWRKSRFLSPFSVDDGIKKLPMAHTDSHGQGKETVWIFCEKVSAIECEEVYDHRRYVGLFFVNVPGAHGVLGLVDFLETARVGTHQPVVSWL